jgi:hypothetical protein
MTYLNLIIIPYFSMYLKKSFLLNHLTKILIVLFIACFVTVSKGQNLVQNPSFEDSLSCPMASGDIAMATGWTTLCASPDYFYTCSASNSYGVPNNIFGYQMPASGNAYSGFATYSNSAPNSREYPASNFSHHSL